MLTLGKRKESGAFWNAKAPWQTGNSGRYEYLHSTSLNKSLNQKTHPTPLPQQATNPAATAAGALEPLLTSLVALFRRVQLAHFSPPPTLSVSFCIRFVEYLRSISSSTGTTSPAHCSSLLTFPSTRLIIVFNYSNRLLCIFKAVLKIMST